MTVAVSDLPTFHTQLSLLDEDGCVALRCCYCGFTFRVLRDWLEGHVHETSLCPSCSTPQHVPSLS